MINRLNLVFWLTLGAWIALIFTLLGSALPNDGAARKIKQALADLVESNAGAIWLQDDQNHYQLKAAINMSFDRHTLIDPNDDLVRHFRDKEWIIGLNVDKADPVAYMRHAATNWPAPNTTTRRRDLVSFKLFVALCNKHLLPHSWKTLLGLR